MERLKLSNNFYLDELVPPELYLQFGHKAQWFIREEVIYILQRLRHRFGPIIVNNWSNSGQLSAHEFLNLPIDKRKKKFTESGLRLFNTSTGSQHSLHKYGCAADPKILRVPVEEVKEDVIKNFRLDYRPIGLTTIEKNTKGWLHFDIRTTGKKEIFIV